MSLAHTAFALRSRGVAGLPQLRTGAAYHIDSRWRSDDIPHALYINHCGNAVLGRIIQELRVTTRLFAIARLADRLEPDRGEHLAILPRFGRGIGLVSSCDC